MGQLGVAYEYDAWLLDAKTSEPRVMLPWSAITWQRVRNNVSVASVTVAEADLGIFAADSVFEHLFPWSTLLAIDRNGQRVWDGPVTSWRRPAINNRGPRGLTINAHDRFALTMKRMVSVNRNVSGDPTSIAVLLMQDARLGTDLDPFGFNVPRPSLTADTVKREYKVDRIERVFDAISELCTNAGLFYTQRRSVTFIDEGVIRQLLGLAGERPRLTETTVVDIPGIEVNGLDMATITYVGGAAQGPNGFPRVASSAAWAGKYLAGTFESGQGSQRSTRLYDLQSEALINATREAAPKFSVEQTQLAPDFGSESLDDALDNLLPGVIMDVDFQDSAAFNVPFLDVRHVFRHWPCGASPEGVVYVPNPSDLSQYRYMLTPVKSPKIEQMRLEQLDVNVTAGQGGLDEKVLIAAVPDADWDGTLPVGWPCPPASGIPD